MVPGDKGGVTAAVPQSGPGSPAPEAGMEGPGYDTRRTLCRPPYQHNCQRHLPHRHRPLALLSPL